FAPVRSQSSLQALLRPSVSSRMPASQTDHATRCRELHTQSLSRPMTHAEYMEYYFQRSCKSHNKNSQGNAQALNYFTPSEPLAVLENPNQLRAMFGFCVQVSIF